MARVGVIQMNSSADPASNMTRAAELIGDCAGQQASLVVLPENFSVMPASEADRLAFAETEGSGPVQEFLARQAREHGIWIVGGTLPLQSPNNGRVQSVCLVFDQQGKPVARYHKIHLFDVQVSDTEYYRESDAFEPGAADASNIVSLDTPAGRLGLSICYDLRFPELYRRLVDDGALIITVPAAFTATTGEAHWSTLIRARAIENQAYVLAPGQWGEHASGRKTHGHSMIVDPWGRVMVECDQGDKALVADIELDRLKDIRERFPALHHRRLRN